MVAITNVRNPEWWDADTESAWDRVKGALKRDWEQTLYDLGADTPDLDQNIGDTVRQANVREAIPPPGQSNFDQIEVAVRFGYGARAQFADHYPNWDIGLVEFLREEWDKIPVDQRRTWMEDRAAIRYGWEFEP